MNTIIRIWKNHCSGHITVSGHNQILTPLLIIYLIVSLVACSSDNTSPKSTATPSAPIHQTPTTLPSGTLLYQSHWSHGLADWHASGWQVTSAYIQSTASQNSILTLPYTPIGPDYVLEVRFQIVNVPQNGGGFVVTADRVQGKDGYTAGILNFLTPRPHSQFANPSVQAYINPLDAMDAAEVVSDYEPGSDPHTYRIEVQGPQVRFFIDGLRKSFATSSQTDVLSNGPIHLQVVEAVVRIFNVRLMTL